MNRFDALVSLVPPGISPVIDVGADHGRVALALGAIATERRPHRRAATGQPWVIADGLAPFRRVGVAVIAGMGWRSIAKILSGPVRPEVAVLHADDDPIGLRRWLAGNGWRLDAERLASDGERLPQLVRAVPGDEAATGLLLDHGPRLLTEGDPLIVPYLTAQRDRWAKIAHAAAAGGSAAAVDAAAQAAFLDAQRRLWMERSGGNL